MAKLIDAKKVKQNQMKLLSKGRKQLQKMVPPTEFESVLAA